MNYYNHFQGQQHQ